MPQLLPSRTPISALSMHRPSSSPPSPIGTPSPLSSSPADVPSRSPLSTSPPSSPQESHAIPNKHSQANSSDPNGFAMKYRSQSLQRQSSPALLPRQPPPLPISLVSYFFFISLLLSPLLQHLV